VGAYATFENEQQVDLKSGEPACPPEATVPDPTLDITVNFNPLTSGSDPFGHGCIADHHSSDYRL